jgi:hypothetical protein
MSHDLYAMSTCILIPPVDCVDYDDGAGLVDFWHDHPLEDWAFGLYTAKGGKSSHLSNGVRVDVADLDRLEALVDGAPLGADEIFFCDHPSTYRQFIKDAREELGQSRYVYLYIA